MSDLFAPMPLPNRPVKQTADIADREAANRNREIDTRMRERLETGSRKMMRDLQQVDVDEQERLYKAEYDRQTQAAKAYAQSRSMTVRRPVNQYTKTVGATANRLYQEAQGANSQQGAFLEKGRLDAQNNAWDMYLMMQRNEVLTKVATGEWGPDEWMEQWQQTAIQGGNKLYFSGHPNFSGYTRSAETKANTILLGHTKWLTGQAGTVNRKNELSVIESTNLSNWSNGMLMVQTGITGSPEEGGPLGWDLPLEEVEAWKYVMGIAKAADPYVNGTWTALNTPMNSQVRNALEQRSVNAVVMEATQSYGLDWSTYKEGVPPGSVTDHADVAISLLQGSELWGSAQQPYGLRVDAVREGALRRLGPALAMERMQNAQAMDEFNIELAEGKWDGRGYADMTYYLRSIGATGDKAKAISVKHQDRMDSQAWDNTRAVQKATVERVESEQAARYDAISSVLMTGLEYLGSPDELATTFKRQELQGLLGSGDAAKLIKITDKGHADLLLEYDAAFNLIDDAIATIGNDRFIEQRNGTSGYRSMYPEYKDNFRHRSLATLRHELRSTLTDSIEAGLEEGDGRLTPVGAVEATSRAIAKATGLMRLTRPTRDELTGITFAPEGEARPLEAYRVQPLPHASREFGEKLVRQFADEDAVAEYQDLPPARQASYAAKTIPFSGYTGDAESDATAHEVNVSLGRRLATSGAILSFQIDPIERQALVQLVGRGEFVTINLDDSVMYTKAAQLGGNLLDAEDLSMVIDDNLATGNASLFVKIDDPDTGVSTPYPTSGAEAVASVVMNGALSVLDFAKLIGERGLAAALALMENIDLDSLFRRGSPGSERGEGR